MKIAAVILILATFILAQAPAPKKGAKPKMATARGTFDVKVVPTGTHHKDPAYGRYYSDKVYHGDLEGTAIGEMLAAGTGAAGTSGAYVAMERVTGKLNGHLGSFTLYHSGSMEPGKMSMEVNVVPGSGTDELTGITGKLTIIIEGKQHSYEFEYTLPPK
ncbi:MAG TPA: DUF3224 domain-containing protein [Terriglobales bacterium]|nr:DUF3224 domain-containing protein [Terriglobales bacterium]